MISTQTQISVIGCILETYIVLLTNVIPIHLIFKMVNFVLYIFYRNLF